PPPPPPPAAPTPTQTTPATPAPKPGDGAAACFEKYRAQLEAYRAHNAAQNPASNSLSTKTMGSSQACGTAYSACISQASERSKTCKPGADGTFTQCIQTENAAWIDCAQKEVSCSEAALRQQCAGK
ncbi:MAG: hypothetical protein WCP29_19340, partial [Acidobacteriota bacterium]